MISIMKSKLLIAFVFIASASFAQVDLVGYGGYQFGSKTYYYPSYVRFKSAGNYGVNLELSMRPDLRLQLSWMGSASTIQLEGYNGIATQQADCNVNYYQVGVIRPFPVNDAVEVFGSFSMGATQYNLKSYTYNDEWRFSITFGLGTNIWLSDNIGIRMHARLLAPINWAGLGFYCGTGGCGTSASAGSTLISGDVGGGLVFRLRQ
jgi:opacity protein-like surface antigen